MIGAVTVSEHYYRNRSGHFCYLTKIMKKKKYLGVIAKDTSKKAKLDNISIYTQ